MSGSFGTSAAPMVEIVARAPQPRPAPGDRLRPRRKQVPLADLAHRPGGRHAGAGVAVAGVTDCAWRIDLPNIGAFLPRLHGSGC